MNYREQCLELMEEIAPGMSITCAYLINAIFDGVKAELQQPKDGPLSKLEAMGLTIEIRSMPLEDGREWGVNARGGKDKSGDPYYSSCSSIVSLDAALRAVLEEVQS
jgi:hypothetical protein